MSSRTLRIGRGRDSDVVLTHSSVSRSHAELTLHNDGALEIRDLGSTGGTFLGRNGRELPVKQATLRGGDTLRFGNFEITLEELLARATGKQPAVTPSSTSPATTPPGGQPAKTRMVRCGCGTIKERGALCPSCGT